MPQGKLKVKTNTKPPQKKNKPPKKEGGVKKGKFTFTAKNQTKQQVQKFQKTISKSINANIEAELMVKAQKAHEGKPFHTLGKESAKK